MQGERIGVKINNFKIEDRACTVKLEELARLQAFYEFQKQIMFSLMVWQTDELIRQNCQHVVEWIVECISKMEAMVSDRTLHEGKR